ncbi:MAG: hypothetical protein A2Z66_09840 [Chloroflexi bacterium RBG_13_66_10]|nr:MAG: hypothetical protein A2Z66_09840 [Chloroflexi bacterium RBG_13_66_10]
MDEFFSFQPLAELRMIREALRQLLEGGWAGPRDLLPSALTSVIVLTDVLDSGRALVVRASMPGVTAEHLKVTLTGDTLTIKGEVRVDPAMEGGTYLRRERHTTTFARTLRLPIAVDAGQAEAVLREGVLTLTLPKRESVLPRAIEVSTG